MLNRLVLVLAAAGLAALVAAPAGFAQDANNLCDVPTTEFPTIQSAVDQPLCFTIRLPARATFTEQLTIGRSLTIAGQSFQTEDNTFISTLRPPAGMVSPALIEVVGPRTRLKIKRLAIEGPSTGAAGLIGIRAARDTKVTIRDCAFRDIQPPQLNAQGDHVAMRLGGPLLPLTKVGITGHSITNCTFDGYQNAAIIVEGVGTTALIDHNLIEAGDAGTARSAGTAAPTGVLAFDGAIVTINRNSIRGNSRVGGGGAAVLLNGAGDGSVVSYNSIDQNDLGVGVDGTNRSKVYRNHISENDRGISLGETAVSDFNTIQLNVIDKGGTALRVGLSSSNSISSNNLLRNSSGDGAVLSAASAKNKMYRNRADNNGGFGFLDESSGRLTGGTANTYTSNTCSGNNDGGAQSSPAGLCR